MTGHGKKVLFEYSVHVHVFLGIYCSGIMLISYSIIQCFPTIHWWKTLHIDCVTRWALSLVLHLLIMPPFSVLVTWQSMLHWFLQLNLSTFPLFYSSSNIVSYLKFTTSKYSGGRTEIYTIEGGGGGGGGVAWEAANQPIIHVKRLHAMVKNCHSLLYLHVYSIACINNQAPPPPSPSPNLKPLFSILDPWMMSSVAFRC